MNNIVEIEILVSKIMHIEKESMLKKFDTASGYGERYSSNKADTDVVNKIVKLLEDGDK